ncbi:MAG: 50S ribosomal protein L3 [Deltaproteobacteria bacterium]|nr:50S ribosomal protein L3 [Deltaproteobacteria bacterium]MBW2415388.1 50S ribosomal protein L3 [Deltaproteobacteria bacterium]
MNLELLGRKLGMTQIFTDAGERVPVTVIAAGPCVVVQKKTAERDGYCAVQFGFEERKEKHTSKAAAGHVAAAGVSPKRFLYEVRLPAEDAEGLEPGQEVACGATFEGVAKVDVAGTSKGRGFTGVIKRWNFSMPKATHGTHEHYRHAGALGAGTYPGRIVKGKKMAGQHGNKRTTTLGLRVERLDAENGLIFVRGSVPGHNRGLVRVRASTR